MLRPSASLRPDPRCQRSTVRLELADGAVTTLHVASYAARRTRPRVVALDPPRPLLAWCRERGVMEAVVGGFFTRPAGAPLGELRIGGRALATFPFDSPWGTRRACVEIDGDRLRIARREALPARGGGDLLQAGPLLVSGGRAVGGGDAEGFSAASHQFDSDITRGRYPRSSLALAGDRLLAAACEGRADDEAGLTLSELAEALVSLGASDALNLDGGGSASLVGAGRLRNRPREEHGIELAGGRPVATAIVFELT